MAEVDARQLFDLVSPVGILVVDEDGKITLASRAAAKTLALGKGAAGARRYDAAAWPLFDYEGRPLPKHLSPLRRVMAARKPVTGMSHAVKRPDGALVRLKVYGAPRRNARGRVTGAVFAVWDVTEQVSADAQLIQAQKMEAFGRLVAGITHDFNNQLMVINGYCEMLARNLADDDPKKQQVGHILAAGNRSAALTSRLLAFSRKHVPDPQPTVLDEVVRDLAKPLGRIIGEDIRLSVVARAGKAMAVVDRPLLEQAIINLAINARDAMPHGGTLVVETAAVELDKAFAARHPRCSLGPHVMIAVSDNGAGMDAETRKHIFDPFFTTKPSGQGTGLGLSMVYSFTKHSGGSIYVYSEPGQGTTFRIYLPLALATVAPLPAAPPEELREVATETVLLAEDDEAIRQLVTCVLREGGYTVLEARNAAEVLSMSGRHRGPIDLFITDVVMPQASGPELAGRLRTLRPTAAILYTSGYTKEILVSRGLAKDDTHLLSKPFTRRELVDAVRQALRTRSNGGAGAGKARSALAARRAAPARAAPGEGGNSHEPS